MDGTTLREMASKHNLNIRHLKSTVNSDTTLFFIHGSMGSLTMYSSLIEKYEGKVNIVAYDTMGCGLSDKPELKTEYSTEALTKYAVEIFETFSTAKNVLIGHSYGTAQIARLCNILRSREDKTMADRINGVVLLGTVDTLPKGGSPAFAIFNLPLFLLRPLQGWMIKSYVNVAFSPLSDQSLRKASAELSGRNKMHVCKYFYQQFEWADKHDWEAVSYYPVLICQGKDDQVTSVEGATNLFDLLTLQSKPSGSHAESKKEMSDPNSCIRMKVIEKAGHHLMEEEPAIIASYMEDFFKVCSLNLIYIK
mmetsp:Transcript_10040/g.9750  ORF Transcript_10040/g.9750 Transcript_10040/m.9750 type:complete len:308 (-) Transcript_10040:208-1131(-)|eukprot:CAMPEP_0119040110 /NCGR_PEP_ID=MMETSP1177-20130426/9958_1 /TAXON_ID=2985 /ORGANISM="Ochromonas sp, Strain CCMP1899" /LENGTH=307 /DNA_ID=CAMNT_0007004851 /DNA_START=85 /DNA_END=1008 /DNA_ORIENTATION=+